MREGVDMVTKKEREAFEKKQRNKFILIMIIIVVLMFYPMLILSNKEETEYTKTEKAMAQTVEFGEKFYEKCVIAYGIIGAWAIVHFKLYDERGRKNME